MLHVRSQLYGMHSILRTAAWDISLGQPRKREQRTPNVRPRGTTGCGDRDCRHQSYSSVKPGAELKVIVHANLCVEKIRRSRQRGPGAPTVHRHSYDWALGALTMGGCQGYRSRGWQPEAACTGSQAGWQPLAAGRPAASTCICTNFQWQAGTPNAARPFPSCLTPALFVDFLSQN